jgi:hypothetical protein
MKTKQESWTWLAAWVEDLPSRNANWTPFTAFVTPVLSACVCAGLNEYFRVGQSMSHIIFSTADDHGLEKYNPPPPRVTLLHDRKINQWFIAWSHLNLIVRPEAMERQDCVTSETVLLTLKSYLADLWRETQNGKPLPPALDELGSLT